MIPYFRRKCGLCFKGPSWFHVLASLLQLLIYSWTHRLILPLHLCTNIFLPTDYIMCTMGNNTDCSPIPCSSEGLMESIVSKKKTLSIHVCLVRTCSDIYTCGKIHVGGTVGWDGICKGVGVFFTVFNAAICEQSCSMQLFVSNCVQCSSLWAAHFHVPWSFFVHASSLPPFILSPLLHHPTFLSYPPCTQSTLL